MKLKRWFFRAMIISCVFTAPIGFASAAPKEDSLPPPPGFMRDTKVVPYVNVTKWFYRYDNGHIDKRLWSYTYFKWMTDWIRVG